jgi:hypothetical protein
MISYASCGGHEDDDPTETCFGDPAAGCVGGYSSRLRYAGSLAGTLAGPAVGPWCDCERERASSGCCQAYSRYLLMRTRQSSNASMPCAGGNSNILFTTTRASPQLRMPNGCAKDHRLTEAARWPPSSSRGRECIVEVRDTRR